MKNLAASLVFHYLEGLTPEIARMFLAISPTVDMSCDITLEEIVKQWLDKKKSKYCTRNNKTTVFCNCKECKELKKLYFRNLKGRKRERDVDGEVPMKLNYRHYTRGTGEYY